MYFSFTSKLSHELVLSKYINSVNFVIETGPYTQDTSPEDEIYQIIKYLMFALIGA